MKHKTGIKGVLLIILLPLLTSCATYNSGFACGDARGANCTSMDAVDRMISSGEIARFNEANKKCKGRRCKSNNTSTDAILEPANNNSTPVHFINKNAAN